MSDTVVGTDRTEASNAVSDTSSDTSDMARTEDCGSSASFAFICLDEETASLGSQESIYHLTPNGNGGRLVF